jgi:hypothetical protein
MHELANVSGIESTLNSVLIIMPIKAVRHWCLTEFIGHSLEVAVWLAYMRAGISSAATEWQVRCKSDVTTFIVLNSRPLSTNRCENMDMVMKNHKSGIRLMLNYFELLFSELKRV